MSFFAKMERKFGRYAIHNLMNYFVIMYVTGMLIQFLRPGFYETYLSLYAPAILKGQVWRIFTFLICPPFNDLFSNMLMIYLYYSLGNTLERVWGAFRFNVYMLIGIIGHILAALVVYLLFGQAIQLTTGNLCTSLFLAFAATFPEMQFLLYFVIPVKAKWLGIFYAVISFAGLLFGGMSTRVGILLSFANFLIFFFMTRNYSKINPKEIKRKKDFQAQVRAMPKGNTHHKCAVCGRTELDGDNLEFRFCSKCDGNLEYCQDHLYTHKHVTAHPEGESHDN